MQKEKKYLKPNINICLAAYVLCFFILGSVIMLILYRSQASLHNLDYDTLYNMTFTKENILKYPEYIKSKAFIQGISNFIIYLLVVVVIAFYGRDKFYEDFRQIKERKKFYIPYILISSVAFAAIAFGVDKLLGDLVVSDNQNSILAIFEYSNPTFIIISTVILAPIAEEFIFRKYIFTAFKKQHVVFKYAISITIFTLIHVLSTDISEIGIAKWLLMVVPYFISAFNLTLIYHKSNENIYASILAHMCNNLLSTIIVLNIIWG